MACSGTALPLPLPSLIDIAIPSDRNGVQKEYEKKFSECGT
jgi:hypothetical protein